MGRKQEMAKTSGKSQIEAKGKDGRNRKIGKE